MNPERHQQICDLFARLCEQPSEAHNAFLDQACADDADLRREVEAMLAADAHPLRLDSFPALDLGEGLQDGTETKLAPVSPPPMPDRIGHYSIRRVIASGGMGVVYEAIQNQPHRTVALKVLRRGIASPSTLRRFEYESQILARLRHPHIAQVYEAGTHNEGTDTVPYFAMEYIPSAMTLLQYATETKLDHRQRLELFIKVCDAVHHGHQKGIIHRDLKPGNILVDSAGEPKVIDFGVARATDSDMALTTLHTDVGQLIGTLQYMSPEQCEADPHDLDSRSDIYALGVVLYELLCGQLPYDISGASIPEAVRIIREHTPTRPSTIVRRLRSDTETIVLKALAKERDRRYRSAAQLADDIRHYLNDEPILARPPSTFYQFRKFARRNRVLVGSVTIVLIALIAAVAVSTTFAIAEQEQRTKAEREADIAQAVNQFLNEDLLAAVAPSAQKGKGKDVSMRDVLDEAAKRIEGASAPGGRFEDQPLVAAAIRTTLGATYQRLGEYEAAQRHLTVALELRRAELGEEHLEALKCMRRLGDLHLQQGRYDDAEPLLSEALRIFRKVLGEEHSGTLEAMNTLASLYESQGRFEEAEPLYTDALAVARRTLGEDHEGTLAIMNNLAGVQMEQGRYEEAALLYGKVLEAVGRLLGENHPVTLMVMDNLAMVYTHLGRFDEAEPLFVKSLETQRRVKGDDHPDTLIGIHNMGRLMRDLGRLEEAEALGSEAVRGARAKLAPSHLFRLAAVASLGRTLAAMERFVEAEPELLEAHSGFVASLGDDHPASTGTAESLAELYDAWHEAEPDKGYDAKAAEWKSKLEAADKAPAEEPADSGS